MVDIFSYTVYLSLLLIVIVLISFPTKNFNKKITLGLSYNHIIALLAISFVVGFRYYVGNDWEGYRKFFENLASTGISTYEVEPGYFYVNKFVINIGGDYTLMFAIIAFISWFFIFKSTKSHLLPLFIFFIFADEFFFWSMNGVRQFVAIGIFLFAIQFIINHNMKAYFLLIALAMMFHISALVLLPLYFIPFQKLYNQKIWFSTFIISFFFTNVPFITEGLQLIFFKVTETIPLLSVYLRYFEGSKYQAIDVTVGLGYYFRILITFFILYFSKEIVKQYPQTKIYFVLFFASMVIFNLFYMFSIVGRINNYFIILRSIVLAIIIYYLWKNKNYRVLPVLVILLYFALFLFTIYNSSNMCSPFRFSFM